MLSCCGSGPFENAMASDWAEMVDGFQKSALESRFRIPLIYGIDAVHGNNSIYGSTIFPYNIGLGAISVHLLSIATTKLYLGAMLPCFLVGVDDDEALLWGSCAYLVTNVGWLRARGGWAHNAILHRRRTS
ncbi:hypothetical protein K1719_024337 [Acacia pycnantha]|nr:hypothetical protein K1719_024337 [Acacia pycnantha]